MLHLITEGNKELKNRYFVLPNGIRKHLQQTLDDYNASGADRSIDGYKRLNNILSTENGISYEDMKRIKNFFDNYKGTPENQTYILNGGDAMHTWVNNTLNTAEKAIKDKKQALKDAGVENAFIRHHTKSDINKRASTPTTARIQTNNANKNIGDNNSNLKFESTDEKHTVILTEEQIAEIRKRL